MQRGNHAQLNRRAFPAFGAVLEGKFRRNRLKRHQIRCFRAVGVRLDGQRPRTVIMACAVTVLRFGMLAGQGEFRLQRLCVRYERGGYTADAARNCVLVAVRRRHAECQRLRRAVQHKRSRAALLPEGQRRVAPRILRQGQRHRHGQCIATRGELA